MATSLTFKELISSTITSGSEFYVNKNSSGDTAEAIVVFNKPSTVMNISAYYPTISSVKVGGNNIFTEIIYVDFTAGKYSYTSGWSAASFSTKQDEVSEKDGTTSSSVSLTGSSNSVGDGWYPAYKILVKAKNATVGDKVVMSGFSLSVDYTVPQYTITWANIDGNGGSTTTTVNAGTVPTYSGTPTKTGFTFSGWSPSVVAATANATYTAQFTENKYTIAFNGNGNTGGSMTSMTNIGYDDSTTLTANAFTKTGYTFAGWATSASGSVVYSDKASVSKLTATNNATVTLYAKWTANSYTIKFNANGGSGSMSDLAMTYDTAKNLTANSFTRTGYTFLGWSKSSTATTATYADKASVKNLATSGSVTLYAVWEVHQYTITVNIEPEGTGSVSVYDADNENFAYSPYTFAAGTNVEISAKAADGYEFKGWRSGQDFFSRSVLYITVTEDATYTAVFQRKTYLCTFKNGDGSTLLLCIAEEGTLPSCSKIPTKESTVEFEYVWDVNNPWTPAIGLATQDQVYEPNFIAKKRTYSVIGEPISTEMGTVTGSGDYEYGSTATLIATPHLGYKFVEWSDGETSPTREITVAGACNYTAYFERAYYTFRIPMTGRFSYAVHVISGSRYEGVSYAYTPDSIIKVRVTAKDGYVFSHWEDGNTENPRNFTISSDITIGAVCKEATQVYSANTLTQPYSGDTIVGVYVGNTKI